MKFFNSQMFRTAAKQLRSIGTRSTYANDLVQRTLARHGLAPEPAPEPVPPTEKTPSPAKGRSKPPAAPKRATASMKPRRKVPRPASGASFTEAVFSSPDGSRRFMTYVPSTVGDAPAGLIMMLHGCTQTPEDFSAGTRMNDLAETYRLIVVYPHQSRGENAQSCWNWFRRSDQARGRGEPAILAALAQKVGAEHGVPPAKCFVAGLSAGAAMAIIIGDTYPDVFSAVGAHSGLPAGAAKDVASAFSAMAGKGTHNPKRPASGPMRTIVFHGIADATVHPSNSDQIARQAVESGPRETVQTEERGTNGGRSYVRTISLHEKGPALVEQWAIEGLGHAWSGGSSSGSYTDPKGPDASAAMIEFFLSDAADAD